MEIIMGKDIVINKRGTGMIPILFSCMETSFVFGSDIKITHSFHYIFYGQRAGRGACLHVCLAAAGRYFELCLLSNRSHYSTIKFILQCITYESV